mmetsp:Transcript_41412/g.81152  ORF Transcript_41412/g.81152 Transcript_41412/m.81152 type:complete len:461 (+) Transcript_41412:86-1468(+)
MVYANGPTEGSTGGIYYGVRKGRTISSCVFLFWHDCADQVEGFDGAEYVVGDLWTAARFAAPTDDGVEGGAGLDPNVDVGWNSTSREYEPSSESVPESASASASAAVGVSADLVDFGADNVAMTMGEDDFAGFSIGNDEKLSIPVTKKRKKSREVRKPTAKSTSENSLPTNSGNAGDLDRNATIGTNHSKNNKTGAEETEWKRKIRANPEREEQYEKNWAMKYEELKKYREEHGHCNLGDCPLRGWVYFQKLEYRNMIDGKRSRITSSKIKKLTVLGIKLAEQTKTHIISWEERLEQLREFKRTHGHLRVPHSDPVLGAWIKSQRSGYAHYLEGKKDRRGMNESRVQQLTELGFIFRVGKSVGPVDKSKIKSWQGRFEELVEFKTKYGHTRVPHKYIDKPMLARWVLGQRREYKKMKDGKRSLMTPAKAMKLFEIDFVFNNTGGRGKTMDLQKTVDSFKS